MKHRRGTGQAHTHPTEHAAREHEDDDMPRRRLVGLLGGGLVLLTLAGAGLLILGREDVQDRADDAPSSSSPAVATDPPAATGGGAVDVVVTHAAWHVDPDGVDIEGFVSGVVEDGGTCRVVLTRDGVTLSAEAPAVADARTTVCPTMGLAGESIAPGLWQVELTYESTTSAGSAPVTDILVPTR